MRHDRPGFTLVEVLVALAVASAVVMAAREMLVTIGAHIHATQAVARQADERANREAIVRDVVGRMALPVDSATAFAGDERYASFPSWCETASEWQEPCVVSLRVEARPTGARVVAALTPGAEVVLAEHLRSAQLQYLFNAESGGRWATHVGPSLITPHAIAVLMDADTLLLRVGDRR